MPNPIQNVLNRLQNVQRLGNGWKANCPAHADINPSLSISVDGDIILMHCHAGCTFEAVRRAANLTFNDMRIQRNGRGEIVAEYSYNDEQGNLLYQKLRYDPKDFRIRKPDGQGGWSWFLRDIRRVIYHLDELQGQSLVYIVEGEKDADNLRGLGLIATCNDFGASKNASTPKWIDDYTTQVVAAGITNVVIIPDNDASGEAHTQGIARSFGRAGRPVKIVRLPELPDKGDVSDWLQAGHTIEELQSLVANTEAAVQSDIVEEPASQIPAEGEVLPGVPSLSLVGAGTTDQGDVNVAIETLLLELDTLEDPWVYLQRVKDGVMAERGSTDIHRDRQFFLPKWYSLVARRSESEKDALISAASRMFGVRTETMRDEIEGGADGSRTDFVMTINDPNFVADVIKTEDPNKPIKFLVYRFETGQVSEPLDEIQGTNGILYRPFQSPLLLNDTVMIPTGTAVYESEESLYQEVLTHLQSLIYCPTENDAAFLNIMAGYVMMTWLYDRLDVLGYLRLIGQWGTGKSAHLRATGNLCYRPIISLGTLTAPVLFRVLHKFRGTLALDEADFSGDASDDIFRILNGGYDSMSRVLRCVGDEHDVEQFNVYGPKLLSGRKPFPDKALDSRCFAHTTKPISSLPNRYPIVYTRQKREEARLIHNKLLLWRFHRYQTVNFDPYERIPGVESRGQQIMLAMLACIRPQGLQEQLIMNAKATGAIIADEWSESSEGLIVVTFLNIVRDKNNGEVNYETIVSVSDIANRIKASRVSQRDELSESVVGKILSGCQFKRVLGSRNRQSGYKGGEQLRGFIQRYGLMTPIVRVAATVPVTVTRVQCD